MHVNADTFSQGQLIECDVVIVGAGPAGLSVASELENSGHKVLLLESGSEEFQWAKQGGRQPVDGAQKYDVGHSHGRGFGGSTGGLLGWGWQARPLDPQDFRERKDLDLPGWPFSREDLEPYYTRAHKFCSLGPNRYDAQYWLQSESKPSLYPNNGDAEVSVTQLGDKDTFTNMKEGVHASGTIEIVYHATVKKIVCEGKSGPIEKLEVVNAQLKTFEVKAEIYVVAGGGIDTPRLLLASSPEGIGNHSDRVGRYFMEHPHLTTGHFWCARKELMSNLNLYFMNPSVEGTRIRAVWMLSEEVQKREGLLNLINGIMPVDAVWLSQGFRALRNSYNLAKAGLPLAMLGEAPKVLASIPRLGWSAFQRSVLKRSPEKIAIQFWGMAEATPDPESRVTLQNKRDAFGLPIPKLTWKVQENDMHLARRTMELMDERMKQEGLGHFDPIMPNQHTRVKFMRGWHHMGTARMHTSPNQGVVDENCRVHGHPNLYIAGSSVFPRSGASNPTLTVVALSLRLADHLKKEIKGYTVKTKGDHAHA